MKKLILSTLLAVGSTQAYGALSASMESVREYSMLMQHQELHDFLGAYRRITSIKKNNFKPNPKTGKWGGYFSIMTEHKDL